MPRCVAIGSSSGRTARSLARSVLTWVSTVRSVASPSAPQTSSSSASRERMRPGVRSRARSRPNSSRVRASHWPAEADALAVGVELEQAGRRGRSRRRHQRRAAQQRAHAGDQLARAERLGQVVVGAQLQADDAVELLGARGQHQDRQGAQRVGADWRHCRHRSSPLPSGRPTSRIASAGARPSRPLVRRPPAGHARRSSPRAAAQRRRCRRWPGRLRAAGCACLNSRGRRQPGQRRKQLQQAVGSSSTAIAARIRPISRVITLMPVRPSRLAMRPARPKRRRSPAPMTTP